MLASVYFTNIALLTGLIPIWLHMLKNSFYDNINLTLTFMTILTFSISSFKNNIIIMFSSTCFS